MYHMGETEARTIFIQNTMKNSHSVTRDLATLRWQPVPLFHPTPLTTFPTAFELPHILVQTEASAASSIVPAPCEPSQPCYSPGEGSGGCGAGSALRVLLNVSLSQASLIHSEPNPVTTCTA